MDQMDSSYLELGTSLKLHGISHKFCLILHNRKDSVLKKDFKLKLFPADKTSSLSSSGQEFRVEEISFGKKIILSLKGISSYEEAKKLLPFRICILKEDLPKIESRDGKESKTFYVCDLLDLDVFEYGTDKKIGLVETYYENGAQIVLVILVGEKTFELPFIDAFFPEVSIAKKRLEMIIPKVIEI